MKWLCFIAFFFACVTADARERVLVCFNYGCFNTANVYFGRAQLAEIRDLLDDAADAAHERKLISVAVGQMLGWAGKQSPIGADRGGNYADEGVSGRMDCIDHSTTTTRLLKILARRGWLRWHRVLEPQVRSHFLFFQHWSAVIEEMPRGAYRDETPESHLHYAVDSWFRDNGKPAVIMPLGYWLDWKDPNDDE